MPTASIISTKGRESNFSVAGLHHWVIKYERAESFKIKKNLVSLLVQVFIFFILDGFLWAAQNSAASCMRPAGRILST